MPDAKLPIVFSHANGFPAGTYRVLFDIWRAAGHAVHAIEKFGHDAAYPVPSNWHKLRDQLIHFTEREAKAPAVFVGHSLGGLLSLLAVCKRPDLAAGLVMIDSPVITGWRAHSLQVVKATGLVRRVSPGRISRIRSPASRNRCGSWASIASIAWAKAWRWNSLPPAPRAVP